MPVEDMRRIAARLAYGLGGRLQWQRHGRGSYPLLHGFLHRCMRRRLGHGIACSRDSRGSFRSGVDRFPLRCGLHVVIVRYGTQLACR